MTPEEFLEAVRVEPASTLLALDFDGTLAPIVNDPAVAFIHPRSLEALSQLGAALGQIAIITGRPVEQVRRLGQFDGRSGLEHLVVLGQYGNERWDAFTGSVVAPRPPESIAQLEQIIDGWLADHGASAARVERKGLAVAVHTRGLPDGVLASIEAPLQELADRWGLICEPGRQVVELRAEGSDKGQALRQILAESGCRRVIYAGDDLGDVPAFVAVERLREEGVQGLLVCSASGEQDALEARADVVVHGPEAVADWLAELAQMLS